MPERRPFVIFSLAGVRVTYNAPVVLTFTFVCAAVMLASGFTGGRLAGEYFSVARGMDFGLVSSWFRLVTHVIGHQSWEHLLANFAFFLLLGPILEEKYGSRVLAAMMLITALVSGGLNILLFSTGLMGASGVVFMFIILASFANYRAGQVPLTFVLVVLLFLLREVFASVGDDNISQFAHILGGVIGSFFGFWLDHK